MGRPELDFAAPHHGALAIAAAPDGVSLGRNGQPPVTLSFSGGAHELCSGARALAGWEGDALVIEINDDEGVHITHSYSLEANGTKLHLRTHIAGGERRGDGPIPDDMDIERIFDRAVADADTAAHP
jgi:hypothetical protein